MTSVNEKRRLQKSKEFSEYVKETREYELLSEYKTVNEHVKLRHNCGNEYYVRPSHFKTRGQRCKMCTRKNERSKAKKKLLNLMGKEYALLSEYKNNKTKVDIVHNECGFIYQVTPDNFFFGKRCPNCRTSSKGEQLVRSILDDNNIKYKEQYRIEECKNKRVLPFDFAVFNEDDNLVALIEYQGSQHYIESSLFGKESFKRTQTNDKIKSDYCKNNNINLITIPYWEKNVEEFIRTKINI